MRRKTKSKGLDSEGMKRLGLCGQIVCFHGKARLFFEIYRIGSREEAKDVGWGGVEWEAILCPPYRPSFVEKITCRDWSGYRK